MSQESDDVSSREGVTALFSLQQHPGEFPQEYVTSVRLVDLQDILYDLQQDIDDDKTGVERNTEEQDFMALPPAEANDDSVFSVGAESQFSDSTPRAAGANLRQELTSLCALRDSLKSQILANGEDFFQWLKGFMSLRFSDIQIQLYGNHPLVAGQPGQSMLVPMLSFYGITTKDMVPRIKHKPNMDAITKNILIRIRDLFTTPIGIPAVNVDCPEPSGTNLMWNVRLTLNGNIFTLITFRIVTMTNINFSPQVSPLSPQNHYIHLLFALLSKACAKDFNCLCAMPDIDVQLFNLIVTQVPSLNELASYIKIFITALAEPQIDSKRSYMITALHNLVSSVNVVDTTITGETLAYKVLFDGDVSGSGANTFNPIMRQMSEVIQILRSRELGLELQVSLCGGRMIYKLGDVLRRYDFTSSAVTSNPAIIGYLGGDGNAQALVEEMKKQLNAPSDSDYTLTFTGLSTLDPGFVQTRLMFFTLCCQLGIKKTIDKFCTTNPQHEEVFLRELAVIGMSLVGGDFQLSSARNSCDALKFLNAINTKGSINPALNAFLQEFPRDATRLTKSSLAPCDLVPKMPSGDYIKKIAVVYIFVSGYVPEYLQGVMGQIYLHIDAIADRISRYSMSTDEGFSSPVKVLFDIFFTLFSIENFTNRAFVTQKINKELKRIAICASILFFHFNELLPGYAVGTEQHTQITAMLQILGRVINYGYNPAFKLLSPEIHNIMTEYASCFVQLLNLYHLDVVFYSRVPDATLPVIGGRREVNLTSLETACMQMIDPAHVPAQAEGLLHGHLQQVIMTGVGFLNHIQADGNLTGLLQIKEHVKAEDLRYKAEGKFLTSVEAFDLFLRDFVPMLVPPSSLVDSLDQLLAVFRSPGLELAELMHFQSIVVIKSENLRAPVAASDLQGLKISGEYQFGVYVILSIFGVKFKSEWSKISLFTKMLFYQLLSRGLAMRDVCLRLLGVDINKVDPEKMRVSSENFMKDQALFLTLQQCRIVLPPPLQTYYGNDKLFHGIDTYRNRLLDTGEVTHSFLHPYEYDTDEDVLSFEFLNSENLRTLIACPGGAFQRLLPDAFQPRAYDFLLKRLTDKFSMLTKHCDDEIKSLIAEMVKESKTQSQSKSKSKKGKAAAGPASAAVPASVTHTIAREIAEVLQAHGGKNTKDIRSQVKMGELDIFIDQFVSELLGAGPVTAEQFSQFMSRIISSPDDACFEGKEDDVSKFRELAPAQRRYWFDHLIEMIGFFKNLSLSQPNPTPDFIELCRQNIKKYFKILFLLKKYLIPKPIQPGLKWLEMSSEQLRDILASLFQPPPEPQRPAPIELHRRRDRAPSPGIEQGRTRSPSPSGVKGRARSRSPGKGQGGGSPKASASKSKPKTRNNNRYSKNARTRKNNHNHKHKRKQHRNRKYKKTTNTKSNRRTKSQSKKNVTFKRRRR